MADAFYATCTYIENLRKAGVKVELDVYHSDTHAFNMMAPDEPLSKRVAERFNQHFVYAMEHDFAPNE